MKIECAKEIKELGLEAIASLSKILLVAKDKCSQEDFEQLKRGVGFSLGKIQMEILEGIYKKHPALDDLS